MKPVTLVVTLMVALLQYKLWFAPGSVFDSMRLKHDLTQQTTINKKLQHRNQQLGQLVHALKYEHALLEERARQDLGMVKQGETYYQFIEKHSVSS